MSRRVVVAGAAVALTAVGLAGLVAFNLGRAVEAQRDALVARVARTLGRPLSVASVRPSYWPLGIRLEEVSVGEGPGFGPQPFLESAGVVVAVRPWSLLRGRVEVAGVVLDRPRILLVRDQAGRWNFASLGTTASSDRDRSRDPQRARRRPLLVPLEWVVGPALSEIRDGTIALHDRLGGDRAISIGRVGLRAEDVRLGGRPRVRVEAALLRPEGAPDAWLDLRLGHLGENDLERTPMVARLEMESVDLSRVAALMGREARVGGTIAGVTAVLEGTLERFNATVDVRATPGRWRIVTRDVDAPAITLNAQVSRDGNTLTLRDGRGSLGAFRVSAHGTGQLRPWRAEVVTRSEEGSGLALPLLDTKPWLSDLEARLTVDPEGVGVTSVRVQIDGAPVEINGRVSSLAPLASHGHFSTRPFEGTVDGEFRGSADDALTVSGHLARIELARAVARLAPELVGTISGRLAGSFDLVARLAERRWRIGPSTGKGVALFDDVRLHDVNVAELLVERVQALPLMPRLVSSRARERYPEIFESRDTTIERATIPLTLAGGRLVADALTMTAGPYQISGAGWIDRSRRTRFEGEVTLAAAVSQTLREDVPAIRYLADADGRVVLPFRLSGRLGEALPEPDVKRLRGRARRVLPGVGIDSPEQRRRGRSDAPERPPRDDGVEQSIIERLERIIQP